MTAEKSEVKAAIGELTPAGRLWLTHGPDPTWNNGAHAAVFWALVRRKCMNSNGQLTALGLAVQQRLRQP